MERISRKAINEKISIINNLSEKEIVKAYWKGTGLKSDLMINGEWVENLSNKEMYNRLEEVMRPIREEYLRQLKSEKQI